MIVAGSGMASTLTLSNPRTMAGRTPQMIFTVEAEVATSVKGSLVPVEGA